MKLWVPRGQGYCILLIFVSQVPKGVQHTVGVEWLCFWSELLRNCYKNKSFYWDLRNHRCHHLQKPEHILLLSPTSLSGRWQTLAEKTKQDRHILGQEHHFRAVRTLKASPRGEALAKVTQPPRTRIRTKAQISQLLYSYYFLNKGTESSVQHRENRVLDFN